MVLFAIPDVWEFSPGEYRIISGHHRIKAAIAAGILEHECNVIIDPEYTEKQAQLDVLQSNQRHGSFDNDLLREFIDGNKRNRGSRYRILQRELVSIFLNWRILLICLLLLDDLARD